MNNLPQANYRGWKQTQANKQPQIKREKKRNRMQVSPPGIHVSVVFSDGLKTETKKKSKGRPSG